MHRKMGAMLASVLLLLLALSHTAAAAPTPKSPPAAPVRSTPSIVTMPKEAIPAAASLESFFVDPKNQVYLPEPLNTSWTYTSTTEMVYIQTSTGYGYTTYVTKYQNLCSYSVVFHKFDPTTGRLLASYNDSVSLGVDSSGVYLANVGSDPRNACDRDGAYNGYNGFSVITFPTAAVSAEGRYLYWSYTPSLGGSGGEEGRLQGQYTDPNNNNTYSSMLIVRRIDMSTRVARTIYQTNMTRNWQLSVLKPPSIAPIWPRETVRLLEMHALAADALLLFFASPSSLSSSGTFGCCSHIIARVNLTGSNVVTFSAFPVALGTTFRAWAHDDSARDLYILYDRGGVVPFCNSPSAVGPPVDARPGCSPQNMVLTKAGAGAVRKLLPLEFFMVSGQDTAMSMAADVIQQQQPQGSSSPPAAASNLTRVIYLSDFQACNIKRMDPSTGDITIVAGYGDPVAAVAAAGVGGPTGAALMSSGSGVPSGPRRPVCATLPVDGPAAEALIGSPKRLRRGSPGTIFFLEEATVIAGNPSRIIRRITGLL